jgi:hypothetical protein
MTVDVVIGAIVAALAAFEAWDSPTLASECLSLFHGSHGVARFGKRWARIDMPARVRRGDRRLYPIIFCSARYFQALFGDGDTCRTLTWGPPQRERPFVVPARRVPSTLLAPG